MHFFQELAPEIKVTVDENSERHSMTTTYIHKLNLGVYMKYNMRHALTWVRTDPQKFDLGPGKLLELETNAFCPGIVLEFRKIILENMN